MLTHSQKKYRYLLARISIVLLIAAVFPIWNYFFYQILRMLVTFTAGYMTYLYYRENKERWVWVMGVIAIIFNPITPLSLSSGLWIILNIVTTIVLWKAPKEV